MTDDIKMNEHNGCLFIHVPRGEDSPEDLEKLRNSLGLMGATLMTVAQQLQTQLDHLKEEFEACIRAVDCEAYNLIEIQKLNNKNRRK